MRGVASATLIGLLAACSSVAKGPAATAPATPPPATASVSAPLPEPTSPSRPMLPLVPVDFSCRLPIHTFDQNVEQYLFVDFPSRKDTPTQGQGEFYDAAVAKWLPVLSSQVSPDGRQYAINEGVGSTTPPPPPTRVDIVDAATGANVHVFTMPDTRNYYYVVAFTVRGVDLSSSSGPGLWRLDPITGNLAKVSDSNYPPDAEWIGAVDPRDASPARMGYSNAPFPNRIDHRDASGHVTTWLYLPGRGVSWIPFHETGKLLVEAALYGNADFYVLSGPDQFTRVLTITQGAEGVYAGLEAVLSSRVFADAHGIWMGHDSMYLFTSSGAFERVHWQGGWPAGPCV